MDIRYGCKREGGFAFIGMGSQYALCFPDKDLIFACISDTQGAGPKGTGVIEPFYDEIFYKVKDSPYSRGRQIPYSFEGKILDLKILPQRGNLASPYAERISNRWYTLNENPYGDHQDAFDL